MVELLAEADIKTTWWRNLSLPWQLAFGEVFFNHKNSPTEEELDALHAATVLRFAGPTASFSNMSFALTDLDGIAALTNLEVLVVIHHDLENIQQVKHLENLQSLFVFNNRIKSLSGIENLTKLEILYAQCNAIISLKEVEKLTGLRQLYVSSNEIDSLEGITEDHADRLETFHCKPNHLLKQREILRVEREIGIICRNA